MSTPPTRREGIFAQFSDDLFSRHPQFTGDLLIGITLQSVHLYGPPYLALSGVTRYLWAPLPSPFWCDPLPMSPFTP